MAERALATAFVNIVPGTKDFDSALKSQLGGKLDSIGKNTGNSLGSATGKSFGSKIKGLIGPALTAASVVAVGRFAKAAILAAEDVTKANSRIEQINKSMGLFGDQTDAVSQRLIDYAGTQELLLATDAEVIKATQAKLLTFKNLALTADETGGAFDRATAAAVDLAAAGFGSAESNAVQLGKALQDPIKGITALARSGVTFTEVEKDKIKALVESGDVLAAQEMVLKAIETQVGGTAAATATSSEKMKLAFDNISESVGMVLLPYFDKFTDVVTSKVVPGITGFFDAIREGNAGQFLGDLFKTLTTAATDFISGGGITRIIEGFLELRQQIFTALITTLPQAITGLTQALIAALPQIVSTLLNMIPNLIQTAMMLFQALITGLTQVVPQLITSIADLLPKLVQNLVTMLPTIINAALTLFMGLVQGLVKAIPILLLAILNALPKIITALLTMLPAIINGAIQLFLGLVNGLVKVIPQLLTTLTSVVLPKLIQTLVGLIPVLIPAAVQLFLALVQGIAKALPAIVSAVVKLVPEIVKGLMTAMPQLVNAGIEIVKGLVKGIVDNAPKLVGGAMKEVGNTVVNTFKSLLGIASPSKVFKEFGKNIIQGLVGGLAGKNGDVKKTMDKVSSWIKTAFNDKKIPAAAAKAAMALVNTYRTRLLALEKTHADITARIEKAQEELTARLEEKVAFVKDISGKFGATIDIEVTGETPTTAALAVKQLQERINKSRQLQQLTNQLISMGLNKDLLKQIVEAGAVDFAASIIAGGQAAVNELNVLAGEANAQAIALAEQVGAILFDEGIKFATSVVTELQAQQATIEKQMRDIATAFGNELKRVIGEALAQLPNDINVPAPAAPAPTTKPTTKPPTTKPTTKPATTKPAPKPKPKPGGGGGAGTPWQFMAAGGFVTGPTPAIIGEAGPEVVTPLAEFERWFGLNEDKKDAPTVNYYAAPNNSLDAEAALMQAMKRAKVVGAW